MLKTQLEAALGRNISAICPNGFHDAAQNHCAHFVSHMLDVDAPFNCRQYVGGSQPGANIRVHELFALCPKVGKKADMDLSRTQIVFVTLAANVDVATKTMVNIPQKHVGIYCDGMVYNYSNTEDRVVKLSLADFETRFQNAYSGHQGIFFGHLPGEGTNLTVSMSGTAVSASKAFALRQDGPRWFAQLAGSGEAEFLVGRQTLDNAAGYYGLYVPGDSYNGPQYSGKDYADRFGHYAYLLELTGHGESKNHFNLINTYDRARFTFGFYQLAAHTPRDNFILLMRDLVENGEAAPYFPELRMINGHLHRFDSGGGATDLEVEETAANGEVQLGRFMAYLNPRRKEIDEQEILHSARMIHMANSSAKARLTQVTRAAAILEKKMARYGATYDLHGKSDVLCAIVADIHHQGRATKARVKAALASSNPEQQLIDINANYAQRARDVRDALARLRAQGNMGNKRYDASSNNFV